MYHFRFIQMTFKDMLNAFIEDGADLNLIEVGILTTDSGGQLTLCKEFHDVIMVDPDLIEVGDTLQLCISHEDPKVPP